MNQTNQTDQIDVFPRQTSLVVALVPAAGRGLRIGGSVPKQFLSLGGEPLVIQSLRALQAAPVVGQIILAVPPADVKYCEHEIVSRQRFTKVTKVVAGALALFDRATARQKARQRAAPRAAESGARGWTRDGLYDRGRTR